MKELDKILIDTSIWIEYFRKKEPYYKTLSKWIDEDKICCIGIILAELLQDAKHKKEMDVLKDFLYIFDFLEESKFLWEKAGELSFNLSKKGYKIGLSDCYIAVSANKNNIGILTLDNHFKIIKGAVILKLIRFANL